MLENLVPARRAGASTVSASARELNHKHRTGFITRGVLGTTWRSARSSYTRTARCTAAPQSGTHQLQGDEGTCSEAPPPSTRCVLLRRQDIDPGRNLVHSAPSSRATVLTRRPT